MTQIAVLVSSKGRAKQLKDFIERAVELSHDPTSLQFFIYLETSDPAILTYTALEYTTNVFREYVMGPPISQEAAWYKLAAIAQKDPAVTALITAYDYDTFGKDWDIELHKVRT